MDIKKFIADLTARYRKLMEQTPRTSLAGAVADVNAAHEAGRKVGYEAGDGCNLFPFLWIQRPNDLSSPEGAHLLTRGMRSLLDTLSSLAGSQSPAAFPTIAGENAMAQ